MTQHEQKPESAEFRTRADQVRELCASCSHEEVATAHILEAEARGAAEQRQKDEEKRELISANLDKPGLIEWSVHILGPDDVHPCGSRAEAEVLAEETNILAGSTNKGRSDDEFVTYAAYVVPRFKADREAEQRRKDAEGAEPDGWQYEYARGDWHDTRSPEWFIERGTKVRPLYLRPANVATLEDRVKELEGVLKEAAYALERVKDGKRGGYNARNGKFVSLQMSDGERGDIIHSEVTLHCEYALEALRSAIRAGGEHG
ncbi:hypothetical protein C0V97_10320 [Asaia sp. W19]|uniref:hypothetical protein n=1 Tax=unclassified Asaia TaxID=2685023 RepID=UPI000F8CA9C4|nr:hypothetical protein [Asaia sp. W19]RUT25657.1 hypothetical protein C0V97_10350 [Asaia sp. W19]RUT25698.1 hypothetical protein C0V97_10320 [Asaia sp. W19]